MIKRLATMAGVVAAMALAAGIAGAYQDEKPTIKSAMGKLHKGGTAALPSVKKALGESSPDWKGIEKTTKLIADLSEAITGLEPPKGDKEGYEKLSKAYATNAAKLHAAAEKEDLVAAKAALKSLGGSCKTCHDLHKGK